MSAGKNVLKIIILISLMLLLPYCLAAQHNSDLKKFYIGMEMGSGWLMFSQNNIPAETTARYALGLYGGYQPYKWLRIGLNVSGWLIEPFDYNDPAKGISLSNTNAQIILLPLRHHDIMVNLQVGRATYTNHHPGSYNAKGTGIKAGVGYELNLNRHLVLPIIINYGKGSFGDIHLPGIAVVKQHYDVIELLVGITYR